MNLIGLPFCSSKILNQTAHEARSSVLDRGHVTRRERRWAIKLTRLPDITARRNPEIVTRSEKLWRKLADEIITGQLPPGTRLYEEELTTRFSVSRTPVREALKHLAAIGLLEMRPQRGMVVSPLDLQRVTDLFEAMAELEAICARFAADRMTSDERVALRSLHEKSRHLVQNSHSEDYNEANQAFHTLIYRGSHNSVLEESAVAIRLRLAPYRSGQFHLPERLKNSFREHSKIVSAILNSDTNASEEAMREHVSKVGVASVNYAHLHRPRIAST